MTAKEAWEIIEYVMYKVDCDEYAANAGIENYEEAIEIMEKAAKGKDIHDETMEAMINKLKEV
jgi:hypothetical protein